MSKIEVQGTEISIVFFEEKDYLSITDMVKGTDNGLDLIEKLKLKNHAILVTSRYEEPAVRNKIINLGIKTIPKNFAPYITIIYKA